MKKSEFLKDVKHEIDMLKKHATKEELSKLDFYKFNYKSGFQCIYGQMTGTCESKRAEELMGKSCIRVFESPSGVSSLGESSFNEIKKHINGENKNQTWNVDGLGNHWLTGEKKLRNYKHLSALEGYICLKGAKVNNIIRYLKGESDKLTL